jgi:hypothetical protein
MKNTKRSFAIALAGLFIVTAIGCKEQYGGPPASLIVKNAKIVTVDKENPRAEAVAVSGEKIIAVTSNKAIEQYVDKRTTTVIDAKGRLVIPGFNDAHIHFSGISMDYIDLHGVTDLMKIQQRVRERVSQVKPGEWIVGGGWEQDRFPEKQWPTKQILDKVAPDNPVSLSRIDGHSIWVNSYVLKMSAITKDTPDPPGGTIVKEPTTGEPTGILKETAGELIKKTIAGTLAGEEEEKPSDEALERALYEARRFGITSIQHLEGGQDQFKNFLEAGKLTLRVTFNMHLEKSGEHLAKMDALQKQFPPENDWLRFGYLKAFIDGTIGSATALYFKPYEDNPQTCGLPQMTYEELEERVIAADKMGFQIGIHATGDKANNWVLNAYEKARQVNGKRDSRHRSEHATSIALDDFPRFANLGVIASVQPSHLVVVKQFAEQRIGLERCKNTYAFATFLQAGVAVAFGSDWNVVSMNPLEGLYAAVTRENFEGEPRGGWFPEQKISMEEAIELYTLGSAYAEFMEDRKGLLKAGYLADMVILSDDLLTIPHDQIMKTKVDYTIVGGKIVFRRQAVD